MKIQYSVEDLRNSSTSLLNEYSTMSSALNNLSSLVNSIGEHWTGNDRTSYIAQLSSKIGTISNYLNKLQAIANNLETAADCYEKHEEQFSASLW